MKVRLLLLIKIESKNKLKKERKGLQSSNSKCSIRPGEMTTIQFNNKNNNKKSMLLTTHLEQGDGVRVSIHIIILTESVF